MIERECIDVHYRRDRDALNILSDEYDQSLRTDEVIIELDDDVIADEVEVDDIRVVYKWKYAVQ